MNERDIVASNLTIAYCAAHPDITSEEKIIEVYRRFLALLTPPPVKNGGYSEEEPEGSFGFRNYT